MKSLCYVVALCSLAVLTSWNAVGQPVKSATPLMTVAEATAAVNAWVNEGGYDLRSVEYTDSLFVQIEKLRSSVATDRAKLLSLDQTKDLLLYGCVTTSFWNDRDKDGLRRLQAWCAETWDADISRMLKIYPQERAVVVAALRHANLRLTQQSVDALNKRLERLDPNSPDIYQKRAAAALARRAPAEALDQMIQYCLSPRVDAFMLRGPLDWFTADSEHAGLKVGDLRELVERLPEGEELEWYVNFGKKLSRTDPAIRVRLEEVAKIRTQVIAKLRELRAAQTKNSPNLSKSTKQG